MIFESTGIVTTALPPVTVPVDRGPPGIAMRALGHGTGLLRFNQLNNQEGGKQVRGGEKNRIGRLRSRQ
jgi:hypothetical protein